MNRNRMFLSLETGSMLMLGVAGCKTTQPLTMYEPVVDTYNVDMVAFD